MCIGTLFIDNSPGSDGSTTELRPGSAPAQADAASNRAPGDPDDTICENDGVCIIPVSDFISRVKGNATYGNATGVIGTFDALLTVNLNGRSPRYQFKFIHDTGPAVSLVDPTVQCIDGNGASPVDSVCGVFTGPTDPLISDLADTYTSPLISTPPLEDEGPYYASLTSFFDAGGFSSQIAPLRSEEWFCPIGGICTFAF